MTTMTTSQYRTESPLVSDDAKVDEASMESFPASDAPSWTSGVSRPQASGIVDVSREPSRNGFWKMLLGWLEAAAVVLLSVLALLVVGTSLALAGRLIVNIVSWVIGSVS